MHIVAVTFDGVRSMEVGGAQLLHSLDGTKYHSFVTPGSFLLVVMHLFLVASSPCSLLLASS